MAGAVARVCGVGRCFSSPARGLQPPQGSGVFGRALYGWGGGESLWGGEVFFFPGARAAAATGPRRVLRQYGITDSAQPLTHQTLAKGARRHRSGKDPFW